MTRRLARCSRHLSRWGATALITAALALATTPASADYRGRGGPHDGGPRHGDFRHGQSHHGDSAGVWVAAGVLGIIGVLALASSQPQPITYVPAPYAAPPPYPPPVTYAYPPAGAPLAVDPASPVYQTADGRTCRDYQGMAMIDGSVQPIRGMACVQADGVWRIVN
jgi:hypothetical protein